MIVFDLDNTLANCEHRRHFVDPLKNKDVQVWYDLSTGKSHYGYHYQKGVFKKWEPNWQAFHEACDNDEQIKSVITVFKCLHEYHEIQIWSTRCESVRKKTESWLERCSYYTEMNDVILRMRPIGDTTPDDQLKERWLDEYLETRWPKLTPATSENEGTVYHTKDPITMVFDAHAESISMWRRRGIFVFDVNKTEKGF